MVMKAYCYADYSGNGAPFFRLPTEAPSILEIYIDEDMFLIS